MKGLTAAIFIVGLVHVSEQDAVFELKSVEIKPLDKPSDTPENTIAKQCGGAGKLVKQANTLCKDKTETACTPSGESKDDVTIETTFEPSKDYEKLGWRTTIIPDGKDPVVDHEAEVPDSKVKKGEQSRLQAIVKNAGAGKGLKNAVKYEIYDPADKTVELCVEVKFEFV